MRMPDLLIVTMIAVVVVIARQCGSIHHSQAQSFASISPIGSA
jgi:hypothetical protein